MLQTPNNPVLKAETRSVLSSRAMLRGVRISQWDGRKLDRRVSDEVNQQKGAQPDAARVNKLLVPPESLARIKAAANNVRAIHARYTLPWSDNGLDILPAASVMAYDSDMRAARLEFEEACDAFESVYPDLVAAAPARLGDMFNAGEFPTVQEVRARFGLRIRTLPMPDASDFRVDMSEAQARAIRAELEAESRAALQTAMDSAFQRVADVCGAMVERLNAYKPATGAGERAQGVFRDSLVQNVRDLVAVLPAFNMTGDPTLADVTRRMESELCRHDADALRDDSTIREETARAAQSILDDVSAFLA